MIKSASEFLALASLKKDVVKVLGKELSIRELSVAERDKMLEVARSASGAADTQAYLLKTCVLDPSGNALFSEDQAAEIARSSPEAVDVVSAAIMRLSGMGNDEKND